MELKMRRELNARTMYRALDARTRIIIVLCLSTLGVLVQDIMYLAIIFILSIAVSLIMKVNVKKVYKIIGKIWYLFIIMVLVQSIFTRTGRELLAIGNFTLVTVTGLIKGAEFIFRLLIIISSATILSTSSSREIVQGMVEWKIPYEIAFMVSVGIRFLPMFGEEIRDTITAIQLRGVEIEKLPLKKRLKLYQYIFMPVILGTIKKAQELSIAMETRAFRAFHKRTSYLVLKLRAADYVIMFMSILASASALAVYYVF